MTITLKVEERSAKGKKLDALRAQGKLPAVVYGPKHKAVALSLDAKAFDKAFKSAGESSVLILSGVGEDAEVLVQEVSYAPLKGTVEHVDFYAIEKGKEVTVNVPLVFVGEAPAIKLGGSLTKALHEIEVTSKPSALPHEIEVDVSTLETFDDSIRIKDLKIPANVTVENDPEETVAVVSEVKEEEEEVTEVDISSIEVEQKGKDKEEDEEAS